MTKPFHDLDRISVRQRLALMVNRYEVRAGGTDGPLLAMAQQKRMALRERVTFFADEGRSRPVFGFQARQIMDLGATYDITDAVGRSIGWFRKDFAQSLLRSTFLVGVPDQGLEGSGTERSAAVALLRRFADLAWPVHFDFSTGSGTPFLSIERTWSLRDSYSCTLPPAPNGERVDWRVAAALAVACDALLAR